MDLNDTTLPEGTGEFLDAWLLLLEKMVNPKAILETTHTLPSKSPNSFKLNFDPYKYLQRITKVSIKLVLNKEVFIENIDKENTITGEAV